MKVTLYPLKFQPILKSSSWGGERIIPYKALESKQTKVGESWELSGIRGDESIVSSGDLVGKTITELTRNYKAELVGKENYKRFGDEFPLLIKFIDAKEDLSIQVHPNDKLAAERHGSMGKTEMWYVIDATPEARLRPGFARQISAEEYVESVENNTVAEALKEYNVSCGDLFFLPAGRVHSIGSGCFIMEIQQTSNITYRIYDFNRTTAEGNKRVLHTELAKEAIDYTPLDDYRTQYDKGVKNKPVKMVECDHFKSDIYQLTESKRVELSNLDSFVILICVDGKSDIECDGYHTKMKHGETLLLPATAQNIVITPLKGECKIISTYIV